MGETEIRAMLDGLCRAAEAVDGDRFASYFTEDGVYHDGFYGAFAGRTRIAEMINQWFFKHARDMRWDMLEPALQGDRLYTRYIFSYNSKLPEANNARTMFEAVSIMTLRDGKIAEYREVADCGTAFADMTFHPERIFKIFERRAAALKLRPEVARHLPSS
ncbi:MAG: nuclear transport factor 2 family protein [Alphaproteobacteria bacterium]|nr:nuclear transport factor 2 family protein [Alphaproteobacteria bacterium]